MDDRRWTDFHCPLSIVNGLEFLRSIVPLSRLDCKSR
jgi:hypothetical protein